MLRPITLTQRRVVGADVLGRGELVGQRGLTDPCRPQHGHLEAGHLGRLLRARQGPCPHRRPPDHTAHVHAADGRAAETPRTSSLASSTTYTINTFIFTLTGMDTGSGLIRLGPMPIGQLRIPATA